MSHHTGPAEAADAAADLSPGQLITEDAPKRTYQKAAASETLEDYSLRYAPYSFRRWTPFVVATTAIGGIAYLADFAIGASIVLTHGGPSGVLAILAAAAIIFVTGVPIARACAKYGVDMDLLTRGAGFGYLGSTLTSLIYASFTFIFFALEGSIMAQGFELAFGMPLWLGYLVTSLMIIPIVVYGMKALSKLHVWTQPIWLLLLVAPFLAVAIKNPGAYGHMASFAGTDGAHAGFNWTSFGLGMGVALSLIAQIGEQADYLRFMPKKTAANKKSWNAATTVAGPGWVVLGAAKQLGGAVLAVAAIAAGASAAGATQPINQYFDAMKPYLGWATLVVATFFVVLSQVKINTTNAYSGSLSWSNFFSRITHRHPGRVYYVALNVGIALILMEANMFTFLNTILGFYSNVGIAWIGAVFADLVINKPLGLSPRYIEFKRAYLYTINPVGFGAMTIASVVSVAAFFKLFGDGWTYAFSPMIALVLAVVLSPVIAIVTKGKYYLARPNELTGEHLSGVVESASLTCGSCGIAYELPHMADCPYIESTVCSLCCSLEKNCHDMCKTASTTSLGMPGVGAPA